MILKVLQTLLYKLRIVWNAVGLIFLAVLSPVTYFNENFLVDHLPELVYYAQESPVRRPHAHLCATVLLSAMVGSSWLLGCFSLN